MIEIGDWRIRRFDKLNLTLEHRHTGTRPGKSDGNNVGEVKWHKTGSYFGTVQAAVMFIAQAELRSMAGDESTVMDAAEFLQAAKALLAEHREWLSEARINS